MQTFKRDVQAPSLREQTYRELRRAILHGELPPGGFVSERLLAAQLNAGQAAVRVAVQRLATEGFLSIQPRRGIIVASQSIQDVIDLFEVRILVEQRVARSVAGRLGGQQIEELRNRIRQMELASEEGDAVAVVENDFAFHRQLCSFHGNAQLCGILDRILDGLYREVWTMTARLPWQSGDVREKHSGIIDAIEGGDAPLAEQLIEEHLRLGEHCVLSRKPSAS